MKAKSKLIFTAVSVMLAAASVLASQPVEINRINIGKLLMFKDASGEVYYMSENGRYSFKGQLVDGWVQQDISDFSYINTIDWDRLGVDLNKISIPLGKGKKRIQVFVGQECVECRELVQFLSDPSRTIKSDVILLSTTEAGHLNNKDIWCADNRTERLKELFITGKKTEKLPKCVTGGLNVAAITADNIGITQLPAVVIEGKTFIGSVEELKSAISDYQD